MRLFFEGHNCWLERRSFGNNLSIDQIKEFITLEILNYCNHVRDVAAAQGEDHCFYFSDVVLSGGANIVRTYSDTEDYVRSQSDSWRTINSYHRVRYSIGHENCCGHCGGTGVNPALIMSYCAYCDGTKIQSRNAIPENFMCKPIEDYSHDKKKYGKWFEHYNSLRKALDECSIIG